MLAKIHRPAKNAMQSGKANTQYWVLEFEPKASGGLDPLMGWNSSVDPNGQVRIAFETKEQAIDFARTHNIPHQVTEPAETKRIVKAYGDNFAYRRKEPWSH
jgi:hypothetical protein